MKDKLNIICCLWGSWCTPHGPAYVSRLYHGVKKHLSRDFRFILLTDYEQFSTYPEGIEVRDLNVPLWDRCLPKLAVYDPALKLEGRVLVMDLDTVITGSLDEIAEYDGIFATRMSFREHGKSGGDMLGFEAGFGSWVWDWFNNKPQEVYDFTHQGRERFLYRKHPYFAKFIEFWQHIYPNQYASYKRHIRRKGVLPHNCRLVSCHGKPRPHNIQEQWVQEHWYANE